MRDLAVCCDLAGVGQDIGLLYMIILVLHEDSQGVITLFNRNGPSKTTHFKMNWG